MYLAGVSVRRVEDITEALWGAKVSSSTVGELNQKIYGKIGKWRMQPIHGEHPYIFVDRVYDARRRTTAAHFYNKMGNEAVYEYL